MQGTQADANTSAQSKALYQSAMAANSPQSGGRKLTKAPAAHGASQGDTKALGLNTTMLGTNAAQGGGRAPNVGSPGINEIVISDLVQEEKHKLRG